VRASSAASEGVPTERRWSLRREWSRAFTIMLALLLVAAVVSIVGVRTLVDAVGGTARQLNQESVAVAGLRSDLLSQEQIAHTLLAGSLIDRSAFIRHQRETSTRFDTAAAIFPATGGMRAIVVAAKESWRHGLMTYGLWGNEVRSVHGAHVDDNRTFGASSDHTQSLLASVESPSLKAMNDGLDRDAGLERSLVVILLTLFGLALAVTTYFRRRMGKDLVRPVASLHEGVLKLQAGDYTYRIATARRDELGDLAEAFNDMAGALHESHVALTLRATRDSLTGLPNRAALTERLASSFAPGVDGVARGESVLFIDIDDFKDVNDSLGHEGGDALLVQLARRLNASVRGQDFVARLGGDEFAVVVMDDATAGSNAVDVAARILDAVQPPFRVNDSGLGISVSIGVAQRHADTSDAAELLRQADFAMYMAKGAGKGRYQVFDAQVHDDMVSRSVLKADLAVAVSSGELRLEYQPVADLVTGEVVGVEALVRWQHPVLGLLAPADFIALAEQTGDIDAVGCWVLDTATRQAAEWRQSMDQCADLWVSVNLSAFQLPDPHSLAAIEHILIDPAVQASHVVLEVTESALAAEVDGGIASLDTLKSLGVRIAVDDFGTGFSSLSTLASLPVDILKIDRSFVSGQASVSPSVPMLEGILMLAKRLSLTVIAEGIEQPEQLDLLRDLGCRLGQGYLLGRPVTAGELAALLAAGGLLNIAVATTRRSS